jgi:cytidylate kinase
MMDTSVAMLTPEAITMRSDHVRAVIVEAIREVAERGRVVIVSHAASIPLAGRRDVLRVLVTASEETRAQRAARDGLSSPADSARFVRDNDAGRADYFQRFYGIERELPTHYDLVINTDALTAEEAADVIVAAARRRA